MVDLANDEFDIEPLKNHDAKSVLKATEKIFKRGILKMPTASIRTDSGTEFKAEWAQFMKKHDIMHKVSLPDRHKQTGNVERLNRELSRIIMGYLNTKDQENGKVNKEWTHLVPLIRNGLNKIRKKPLPKNWKTMNYPYWDPTEKDDKKVEKVEKVEKESKIQPFKYPNFKDEPKHGQQKMIKPQYKVGDRVHHVIDRPQNASGQKQIGGFRMGDHRFSTNKRAITQVLLFPGNDIPYRYMLEGIKRASYSKHELKK